MPRPLDDAFSHPLTDEQINAIAEKAARRALEIVYAEIGMNVMKKLAWIIGVVVLGLALWLAGKNALPILRDP